MKRPSDDDDDSSPESRAEEFAQRVLARSRKLILIGGIVLGIVIPFWGILLAPPLLAIVYAFRRPRERSLP